MSIKSKIVSVFLSIFLVSKTLKLSGNTEAKIVLKKFLKSMLLVAGSCAAIFLLLLLYRKTRKNNRAAKQPVDISKNLNSPESIDAATKFFIEKF